MITKERLEQFKKLYLNRFGITLDDDTAFEKLLNLFDLYQTVYAGLTPGFVEPKVKSPEVPSPRTAQGF